MSSPKTPQPSETKEDRGGVFPSPIRYTLNSGELNSGEIDHAAAKLGLTRFAANIWTQTFYYEYFTDQHLL